MSDISLSSLGAKVVVAASSDENHPPENIIDGNTNTFWMSTGMFPQEFIIRFAEPTMVSVVTVDSYNVKHLKIEKNTTQSASQFEFGTEKGEQTHSSFFLSSFDLSFFPFFLPSFLPSFFLPSLLPSFFPSFRPSFFSSFFFLSILFFSLFRPSSLLFFPFEFSPFVIVLSYLLFIPSNSEITGSPLLLLTEFENTEGHLQSNALSLSGSSATHLRFIITRGYDHFVSVHRVSVQP
uniref:Heat shock protein, alpha-crystallin-related, b11 n=1 Tax=Cynoglossus semilaevis TaxID=244447 RepID=A0A3P8WBM2_CYNSE